MEGRLRLHYEWIADEWNLVRVENLTFKRSAESVVLEPDRQKETIENIKAAGQAMQAWLNDQLSAAAAGAQTYDLSQLPEIDTGEIWETLVPDYSRDLPAVDGWGHQLEFRLNRDVLARQVMSIRSPGADGHFEGLDYEIGAFPPEDYARDIVWADGFFVQYPSGQGD